MRHALPLCSALLLAFGCAANVEDVGTGSEELIAPIEYDEGGGGGGGGGGGTSGTTYHYTTCDGDQVKSTASTQMIYLSGYTSQRSKSSWGGMDGNRPFGVREVNGYGNEFHALCDETDFPAGMVADVYWKDDCGNEYVSQVTLFDPDWGNGCPGMAGKGCTNGGDTEWFSKSTPNLSWEAAAHDACCAHFGYSGAECGSDLSLNNSPCERLYEITRASYWADGDCNNRHNGKDESWWRDAADSYSPSWVCYGGWYGTNDGCDCGCGKPDPDCNGGGCIEPGCDDYDSNVCDYNW